MSLFISNSTSYFGANLQGLVSANEVNAIRTHFNSYIIRDSAQGIQSYAGGINGGLQDKYNSKMRIFCNIAWAGGGSGGGLKNFCTDLSLYESQLNLWCQSNAVFIKNGGAVIENEPANGHYWNFSTSSGATVPYTTTNDYLAMLDVAIYVFRKYGVKVMDGCTHFNYYDELMNNNLVSDAAIRGDELLTGYANLNLDLVNIHFNVPNPVLSTDNAILNDKFKNMASYLRQRTKHDFMIGEWHQEAEGTTAAQQDSLCGSAVLEIKKAHPRFILVFGGDYNLWLEGDVTLPLVNNNDLTLTHLGVAYKNAII